MSESNDCADGDFEAANSRLNQGLKSCRSVVSNYKALLSPEHKSAPQIGDNDVGEMAGPAEL